MGHAAHRIVVAPRRADPSVPPSDAFPKTVRRGIPAAPAPAAEPWSHAALAGRLVELTGAGGAASLTMAASLVLDAQRRKETVAWVTSRESAFFPPDLAAGGVDLEALAVVRLPDPQCVARAAERLLRSGGFGLVVLDLGAGRGTGDVTMPLQARLVGLAEKHAAAVLCLTRKPAQAPSLSSLVSLRAESRRRRTAEGAFLCEVVALKDKRRAPGWTHAEVRHGPPGLR